MWLFYSSTVVSTLVTPAVSGILRYECLAIISPAYRYRKLSMTGHFSSAVPPSPLTSLTECPSSPSIPCPSRKRRLWFSGSGSPPLPNWTSRLLARVFQKRVGGPGAQPCLRWRSLTNNTRKPSRLAIPICAKIPVPCHLKISGASADSDCGGAP